MHHIDKDPKAIEAMSQGDLTEPVVMLNLLKYRDTAAPGFGVDGLSGSDAYRAYGRAFAELNHASAANQYGWVVRSTA